MRSTLLSALVVVIGVGALAGAATVPDSVKARVNRTRHLPAAATRKSGTPPEKRSAT